MSALVWMGVERCMGKPWSQWVGLFIGPYRSGGFVKPVIAFLVSLVFCLSAGARVAGVRYYMDTENSGIHFSNPSAACDSDTKRMIQRGAYSPGTRFVGLDYTNVSDDVFVAPSCKRQFKESDGSVSNWTSTHITSNFDCPDGSSSTPDPISGLYTARGTACTCSGDREEKFGRCVVVEEAATLKPEHKNASESGSVCSIGNPINPATGSKYLMETDYVGVSGALPLRFERRYTSRPDGLSASVGIGWGWRHTYSRALVFDTADELPRVRVLRPNGNAVVFQQLPDGSFSQDPDVNDRLAAVLSAGVVVGYQFTIGESDEGVGLVETYNASGQIQGLKTRVGWTQTFEYSDASTAQDVAPSSGYLIGVTDSSGRQLSFRYNDGGQLVQLIDAAGKVYDYAYDIIDNLISVTNPALEVRSYHYNEADHIQDAEGAFGAVDGQAHLPHAMTGMTVGSIRYADYRYRFDGRGIETNHAGGATRHALTYNADGSTTVIDPLSVSRTYRFAVAQGVAQAQDQDQPCSTGSPYKTVKSDANGNPEFRIDFNGNRTNFEYDLTRNLETRRIEGLQASGSTRAEARTTTTEWHATWRLPAVVWQPLKRTTYTYGANGTVEKVTEQATLDETGAAGSSAALDTSVPARTWAYTYNAQGQVKTVKGPRTDVNDTTTYEYYTSSVPASAPQWRIGDLKSITNALGQVTQFTAFSAHGAVEVMLDANGRSTRYTYDDLGRVSEQSVGGLVTRYAYNNRGLLRQVTGSDGSVTHYTYDSAHRLTEVADALGDSLRYPVIDGMGNVRTEETRYWQGGVARSLKRVFNPLNRLEQEIGGERPATEITRYTYLLGGQLASVTDALGNVTAYDYDGLNRMARTLLPKPAGASNAPQIGYRYNAQGQPIGLTDPRGIDTRYSVDGLGNRTSVVSADAGTAVDTFDEAGNLKTSTDAKGQTTSYTYDALNRVTNVRFHDGASQVHDYDRGANATGRLSSIIELDAAALQVAKLEITYDNLGRLSTYTRTAVGQRLTVTQQYDTQGRLWRLIYPSGRVVTYRYDAAARISGIITTPPAGSPQAVVVQDVLYFPMGGVSSYTYGNGKVMSRAFDKSGRITGYSLANANYTLGYYDNSWIKTIANGTGASARTRTYGFDEQGRLTSATLPTTSYTFQFDSVGNRIRTTVGAVTTPYTYPPNSNRLTAVGSTALPFDANGSITQIGASALGYDAKGRLQSVSNEAGQTIYRVDALGTRLVKAAASGTVIFTYDLQGQLLAETSPNGVVLKEYIYLGATPVAVVAP